MNIDKFFEDQLACWPDVKQRYDELKAAEHKTITIQGRQYDVMFNPARMRSAAAKVEGGKVERPCFLCDSALPKEQQQMRLKCIPSGHEYNLMVNPYPITDHHFTIVSTLHERQDFVGRHWDMAYLADVMSDYLIFFNGACSGASAPDHMHFQAVPKELVPITHWSWDQWQDMGVASQMPVNIKDSDHKNILCWTDGEDCHWLVIDRKCHRPAEYFMEGSAQVLISPASLEFCGLIPMVRLEDYQKMEASLLKGILDQCRYQEPMLHVGIMEGPQIRFSADERTHSLNYVGEDRILQVMDYGSNRAEKREITEYRTTSTPFTLEGVTIGKEFHWQQQEDQTFMGSLRVIAREGKLHAINIIPVEEYLKSVISSEMSATNNLELLKTHAIISRSWVLKTLSPSLSREEDEGADTIGGRYLKIWDGHDHTLYDVCADDHCQRYQGITRQVSPLVAQAIEETRGIVLKDQDGQICDARFSKCCGGKSELFSTCWQDHDYHYLQPVDDPWCDTREEKVLRLVLNDYDQRTIDFHDWEVTYTQEQLTELFNRRMKGEYPDFQPLDTITALNPVLRGPSGRIYDLEIIGIREGLPISLHVGKELLIRKALSESHLYSSAFEVSTHLDPITSTITFVLRGIGWGHGVGLCQIGAANMSQHGKDYREILLHYFTGAQLTKLY